jgi:pantetheine-phosphate adenylyltransferase
VLGGTFDHFHKGHEALLTKAFEVGKKITIGIATEEIYKNKFLLETIELFEVRKKSVEKFIKKHLPNGCNTNIISFSEFTGGVDKIKEIDAIVVSRETYPNAIKINELRIKNKLRPMMIVIIEDILAEDGKLISSERIRIGEIDKEGNKYQFSTINDRKRELIMPENLRPILQKPLGRVFKEEKSLLQCIDTLKHTMIIAVGDIIVDSLLKKGVNPDVKVIDFRSRRKEFPISNFQFSIKSQLLNLKKYKNKPGTLNIKTSEKLKELIKQAMSFPRKQGSSNNWIIIDGEEDLLALSAILFAPLNSLVLYGHWQHGIIVVKVDEKIKDRVRNIVNKFN